MEIVKTSPHECGIQTVCQAKAQGLDMGKTKGPGQEIQGNHSADDQERLKHQQGFRAGDQLIKRQQHIKDRGQMHCKMG